MKKSRILEEHHIREFLSSISFMNAADVRDAAVIIIGFMSGCRIAELYEMKRGGKELLISFVFLLWTTSIFFVK